MCYGSCDISMAGPIIQDTDPASRPGDVSNDALEGMFISFRLMAGELADGGACSYPRQGETTQRAVRFRTTSSMSKRRAMKMLLVLLCAVLDIAQAFIVSRPARLTHPQHARSLTGSSVPCMQGTLDGDGHGESDFVDEDSGPELDALAKSLKPGPFSTTLGKWDGPGEPDFLQEMDWHITSTYTKEELEELNRLDNEDVEKREAEKQAAAEKLAAVDPNAFVEKSYEFIKYDENPITDLSKLPKATVPVPKSWQEYQSLEKQVAALAEGDTDVKLTKKQRDTAARLRTELRDFYPTFKDILGYGWTLGYAPCLEEAGKLILSTKKAKAA